MGNYSFSLMAQAYAPKHLQVTGDWALWQEGGGLNRDIGCSYVIALNLADGSLHSVATAFERDDYCSPTISTGHIVRHRFDGLIDVLAVSPSDSNVGVHEAWVWDSRTLMTQPVTALANLSYAVPIGAGWIAGLLNAESADWQVAAFDTTSGALLVAPAPLQGDQGTGSYAVVIEGADGVAYLERWSPTDPEIWSWDVRSGEARRIGALNGSLAPFFSIMRDANEFPVFEPLPGGGLLVLADEVGAVVLYPDRMEQLPDSIGQSFAGAGARRSFERFLSSDGEGLFLRDFVNRTVKCVDFRGCHRTVVRSIDLASAGTRVLDWPPDAPDGTTRHELDGGGVFLEYTLAPSIDTLYGYARGANREVWAVKLDPGTQHSCICVASPPFT